MIPGFIIERFEFTLKSSIGHLIVPNSNFKCFTIEDVARATGVKIKGETCIPAGDYRCRVNYSPKFKRLLPLIYNTDRWTVEDGEGVVFTGIRCHNGVNHSHTEGCPLLGYKKQKDRIYDPAADDFTKLLLNKYGENIEFNIKIINAQKR